MSPPIRLPVLPATYGACVDGTPLTGSLEGRLSGREECRVLVCRMNLRRISAENVPGRRYDGIGPEWSVDSEAIAASPSCALDVANRGAHRCSEIAEMEGKSKRRIQQEVRAAVLQYKEALEGAGIEPHLVTETIGAMLVVLERERRGR